VYTRMMVYNMSVLDLQGQAHQKVLHKSTWVHMAHLNSQCAADNGDNALGCSCCWLALLLRWRRRGVCRRPVWLG
jgi:hypothetical protein